MPKPELVCLPPRGHDPYVGGTVMNDYGSEGRILARRAHGPREKFLVEWVENRTQRWYFADRLRRLVVVPKEKR